MRVLLLAPIVVALVIAAHSSPTTVDRLHKEFGSSATIQHGSILTALIGDKKIRPQVVSILSPIIDSFWEVENNFSEVCSYIKGINTELELQKWRLENLGLGSQLITDFHKLQEDFNSFVSTMLQGTTQEITETTDLIYNNSKKGLLARIQSLRKIFTLDEENNAIAAMLAKIQDGEKRVILSFLFKKVKKSLKATEQGLVSAQQQIELIKNDPEITSFRDIMTRIDNLEKQVDLMTHFLSMRHKTAGNVFCGSTDAEEEEVPLPQFERPSSHADTYYDFLETAWADSPEYSWRKGF
jgi:hypothetical protein